MDIKINNIGELIAYLNTLNPELDITIYNAEWESFYYVSFIKADQDKIMLF
jgi:hypothetical protein